MGITMTPVVTQTPMQMASVVTRNCASNAPSMAKATGTAMKASREIEYMMVAMYEASLK